MSITKVGLQIRLPQDISDKLDEIVFERKKTDRQYSKNKAMNDAIKIWVDKNIKVVK